MHYNSLCQRIITKFHLKKSLYGTPNVSEFIKVQPKHVFLVILLQLKVSHSIHMHTMPYLYKISLFDDLDGTGHERMCKGEQ